MPPSYDEIFSIRLSLQDFDLDEFTIIKRLKIILQEYNMPLDEINQYLVDFYNSFGLTFTLEEIQNINVEAYNLLSLFLTNGDIQMSINENNPNEDVNITDFVNNIISQSSQNIPVESEYEESGEDDTDNVQPIQLNQNINSLPMFFNDIQTIVPQNMILEPELNMFNTIINYINTTQNTLNQHFNDSIDEDVLVTLDATDLSNLEKITVETKQDDHCTICLQDIEEGEIITNLPCKHYYHHECISKYLKEFDYKCPLCREDAGKKYAHI